MYLILFSLPSQVLKVIDHFFGQYFQNTKRGFRGFKKRILHVIIGNCVNIETKKKEKEMMHPNFVIVHNEPKLKISFGNSWSKLRPIL